MLVEERVHVESELSICQKIVLEGQEGKKTCFLDWAETSPFTGICFLSAADSGAGKPCYIHSCRGVPPQTSLVLTHDDRGYTLFLALSHAGYLAYLEGSPSGLILHTFSAAAAPKPVLIIMRHDSLYELIATAMKSALESTGGFGHFIDDKLPAPKWLETLGWESNFGIKQKTSHAEIVKAVESLKAAGLLPGYVLIEEFWQDSYAGALRSFDADIMRFPRGIKGTVQELQDLGVKRIGVCHGVMGGFSGVSSSLASQYDLPSDAQGRFFLGTDLGKTFQFYHHYYEYLREQGITFTKINNQNRLAAFCGPSVEMTAVIKNIQTAIQAASSVQFDSFPFNSECLNNGNIFYWANSRVAAVAGRMVEQNPLGAVHVIRNSLTTALWMGSLMQPDFGSWTTVSQHQDLLSTFYALSGSLTMINDCAGLHDASLLKRMFLPSGKLLIADKVLTLCEDSVFFNPLETKKVYKAFTRKGSCGLLGAFNLCSGRRTLQGSATATDVAGLEGSSFAVYSCQDGFLGVYGAKDPVQISLKPGKSDILTFSAICYGVAVFGCHKFFLAPATLTDVDIEEDSVHVSMLVAGPLLLYCEKQVLEVRRNGNTVPWEQDSKRKTLSIDSRSEIIETHAMYTILFES